MSIGIGQILLILVIILILFGKFPKIMDDLIKGINNFKKGLVNQDNSEEIKQISSSNKDKK